MKAGANGRRRERSGATDTDGRTTTGSSEENSAGASNSGILLITDWATADWRAHESLAQARPAYTDRWEPEYLAANRNSWARNSFPSRLTAPIDSKRRAEKSKFVPTKSASYFLCFK